MTCTHCGDDAITMSYTLRCTPAGRDARVIELHLCTDCLRSLCTEDDIELVEDSQFVTA
ncbi:hypothetical protein [Salinibaculum salinum]|uniref:hypothetical protein n=1 Tax=Salinibaculum salinum TaxID=3131996 RepID=UPI0030EB5519